LKILIVAASNTETKQLSDKLEFTQSINNNYQCYKYGTLGIDILVTGVGSIFTTYYLTKALSANNYDLAINIGIAGSFDYFLEQGFVVNVIQDQFADLGVEENDNFYTLSEKELMNENIYPFRREILKNQGTYDIDEVDSLIPVKSITVNTLIGSLDSVEKLKNKFKPEIMTTEGAAFFYVCLMENKPFLQLRAISNFVEIRKIENWNIPLALKNLSDSILTIFEELRLD
jgi:futalosine hydrolase